MSISKITEAISPVDKTKKINEVIDAVNGITVNNSTVTFKQGDEVKGTLTTNQSSDSIIELDAGGGSQGAGRNIGEIIQSTIPLNDAGLHLADGAILQKTGIYSDFVDAMRQAYLNTEITNYKADVEVVGSPTITSLEHLGKPLDIYSVSGFSTSNYLQFLTNIYGHDDYEFVFKMTVGTPATTQNLINLGGVGAYSVLLAINGSKLTLHVSSNGTSFDVVNAKKGTYTLTNNLDIMIKFGYDSENTEYYVSYSTDNGSTYTKDISVVSENYAYFPAEDNYVAIGNAWSNNPCLGTIYMEDMSFTHMGDYGNYTWTGIYPIRPGFEEDTFEGQIRCYKQVEKYGVCGKYVAYTNSIQLPTLSGFIEGIKSYTGTGDLTEAGLPNITGAFNAAQLHDGSPVGTGAFRTGGSSKKGTPTSDTDGSQYGFNIDASRSSTIYGNSTTVQPQSIKVLYYIVVANSTKTEIEVDIDEIATDLNGKADRDGSNMVSSVKNFDGQWVSSILPLTTSTALGTFPINLGTTGTSHKNYLPNDNYSYEVLVTFALQHNGQSGGGNYLVVGNESTNTAHTDRAGDTSNNTRIIVVNSSHSFGYTLSGKNVSALSIEAVAYRRLGTNT